MTDCRIKISGLDGNGLTEELVISFESAVTTEDIAAALQAAFPLGRIQTKSELLSMQDSAALESWGNLP